eukprot:CAMPEP_0171253344 /NCGR_PEP_ID=MMETSP0790-20130122/51654_1 /TAXON_ID=2925 /ORGANISM="Alexandrium catenella, Strain OF101" /LENGTH=82 /DNA_ID=CAMNT_0011721165 /DNA_START=1 /DNA_END=245 /DNA_ORIENTATION=-
MLLLGPATARSPWTSPPGWLRSLDGGAVRLEPDGGPLIQSMVWEELGDWLPLYCGMVPSLGSLGNGKGSRGTDTRGRFGGPR